MDHLHDIDESPLESALAIKACLEYMQSEAAKLGIEFGAHMSNVAAAAGGDWIDHEGGAAAAQSAETGGENRGVVLRWRRHNA